MRLVVFGLYIFFYWVHGHSSQDSQGHSWRTEEHNHNHNHGDGNTRSLLDQVLDKHWELFQASDLAKDMLSEGGFSTEKRIHECEHSDFMTRSGAAFRYSPQGRQLLIDIQSKKRDISQNTTQPQPNPAPVNNWKNIRIFVDSTTVDPSDNAAYSCKSAGSQVTLDNGDPYTCTANDILTSSKIALIKDYILPGLIDVVSTMISVVPESGNLVLSKDYHVAYGTDCRGNLPIPSFMIGGTGKPNADYYLIVSARPIKSASVLANALPCSHNLMPGNRLGRPLAGSINFNPASLTTDPKNKWDFDQNIKTALHELTHAMGFTGTLFNDYISPGGGFYSEPVISFTNSKGATKWKVTTPRVIAYAREHYGCATLDGMELEDFNTDPGTPGAHWEARIVDSEYMAGVASEDSQISFLTLTFLEDMGWYKSNYSWSQPFNYGRGEGCNWVTQPCSKATWGRYWCDNAATTGCNGHRTAGGKCGYVSYGSALPSKYTYFSDSTKGGRSGWNDYCPTIDGYSNRYCHQETTDSRSDNYGEQYGPNSACWDLIDASFATDGCYLTQCFRDANDKVVLRVMINDEWQNCPVAGGDITIDTLIDTFKVRCPPLGFFCSPIGSSAVNFTFDPSSNIPIPNAPNAPPHVPFFPDIPLPDGLPQIVDEVKKILNEWGLEVGSTLFWVLIGIGIFLIVVGIFFCCCKR